MASMIPTKHDVSVALSSFAKQDADITQFCDTEFGTYLSVYAIEDYARLAKSDDGSIVDIGLNYPFLNTYCFRVREDDVNYYFDVILEICALREDNLNRTPKHIVVSGVVTEDLHRKIDILTNLVIQSIRSNLMTFGISQTMGMTLLVSENSTSLPLGEIDLQTICKLEIKTKKC